MRMTEVKSRNFVMLRAAILAGSCVAMPAWAQSDDSSDEGGLQEIVVVAQKREQNLQVVPIAVSALGQDALTSVRFASVKDLGSVAPGLTIRESPGGAAVPTLTMRGVYGATAFGAEAGVALYTDGVYINGNAGAQFALADLERIEVLRGPQGTLFGRNAIGGAVNLISREPSGEFAVRQELSYGNLNAFRSKTRVDLPQVGPLSASVTYLHDQRDGDVRNLGAGVVWDYGPATGGRYGKRTSVSRLGGQNIEAVSATLKLEPGSDIKAIYKFDWSGNDYTADGVGTVFISDNPNFYLPTSVRDLYDAQPDRSLMTPVSNKRPDAVNNSFTTPSEQTSQSHILTISAPLVEGISFKNIAAYRKSHVFGVSELSGIGGLIYTGPDTVGFGGPVYGNQPVIATANVTMADQENWSNEFQVNVDTDWFNLTVGLLYFHSKTTEGPVPGAGNVYYLASAPNYVLPPVPGSVPSFVDVKSKAVYMQFEGHLTDALSVVLGSRITKDTKDGIDNSPTPFGASIPIKYRESTPTYLAGINYKLTENVFSYAKFSTAYISGGQLDAVAFDPSTVKSWEAGVKADLFDRKVRLNLAVFTAKYGAVQILTNPRNTACVALGASPFGSQCMINGGDARANGFELESTFLPIPGLTLQGNLAFTDFKFTSVAPSLRDPVDGNFEGIYRPRWTGQLMAQYDGPEMFGGAHLTARVDANYTSSQFPFPNGSDAEFALAKIPTTWLVNGRLGLAGFEIGGGQAEVALWAKNLFNDRSLNYVTLLTGANIGLPAIYNRARTFGVDLNLDF